MERIRDFMIMRYINSHLHGVKHTHVEGDVPVAGRDWRQSW